MPHLFISDSSRRPQFVSDEVVEENWGKVFGSVNPTVEKVEERERKEEVINRWKNDPNIKFKIGAESQS